MEWPTLMHRIMSMLHGSLLNKPQQLYQHRMTQWVLELGTEKAILWPGKLKLGMIVETPSSWAAGSPWRIDLCLENGKWSSAELAWKVMLEVSLLESRAQERNLHIMAQCFITFVDNLKSDYGLIPWLRGD